MKGKEAAVWPGGQKLPRKRDRMIRRITFVLAIALLAMGIVGCGLIQKKSKEGKALDYTVMKEEDFPPEISKLIEAKKQQEFQMSYLCEGELYILKGYGIQSTGGYSIRVEYVKEIEDEIHIRTELVGPDLAETAREAVSNPYLVVKVDAADKTVIFD